MAIPEKYVLYCNYPGAEFREEIYGFEIDYSDKADDETYCDYICENSSVACDRIADGFTKNFEKLLDDYFSEDMIPAQGYICYDEVRTDVFSNSEPCLKKGLKFYLDAVDGDGKSIDTKEIKIEDFVNMKRQQAFLMECGFFSETDEYIEIALGKFVDKSKWYYSLRNGDDYLDIEDWPEPQEDGTWVDDYGNNYKPFVWFGDDYMRSDEDMWVLNGENLVFWLSGDPNYVGIVECHYDGFVGFRGEIPGFEEVVKSCPISIENSDTPESIDKKIQSFFVKKYNEKYPAKHILHCDYPGAEFRKEFDSLGFFVYDDESYSQYLCDEISNYLEDNINIEPFLDKSFTEEDVPASGFICNDDVRMDLFGNGSFKLNKDIKVYLDTINREGTTIDSEEIDISDYINLKSKKED